MEPSMKTYQLVVADAATARFYSYQPDQGAPKLLDSLSNPSARKHERELVSSRPGRIVDRGIGHTQSFDPRETAKQHAIERFATQIAKHVDDHADGHGLVLVAADRLLARIEHGLTPSSHARLVAAVPRDLCWLNPTELGARLRELGPLEDSEFARQATGSRNATPTKAAKKLHAPVM